MATTTDHLEDLTRSEPEPHEREAVAPADVRAQPARPSGRAVAARSRTPLKARLWARKHFGGGTTRINGVTFIVSGSPHLRQIEMKA